MQEVQAPFVLESLDCDGSEARLVDCPVSLEAPPGEPPGGDEYAYTEAPTTCDPSGLSYAFVACGMAAAAAGPGLPQHQVASHTSDPVALVVHVCSKLFARKEVREACIPAQHLELLAASLQPLRAPHISG